ncbi:MAG: substrate-binding domain-containing protein [Eubacteriales bacterium]|nr:substrate-binding domain-containing protein [Eubacteriales bacterium]MDD4389332.1 substrate-binding domain-containing protein [Eubacteriales bacterium]
MKRFIYVVFALVMVLSLGLIVGCAEEEQPEGPALTLTPDTIPSIDGATALAPFYEAMAAELMNMDIEEARQYVMCSKTDGAYERLISREAEMIFCSMPSREQKASAEEAGFEFEMTPFLNGGFVFFVNKDNPVDSLSVEQLHDIYSGKITNWKQVGGNDVEIIPYQRPNNSGSQTGMYEYVIAENEIMEAPTEKKIADMGGIIDAVASYDNAEGAIGYSYYYYVMSMHYTNQIKMISIEGIAPSDETIGNGTYPLVNPSYVIISKDTPKDSILRETIKWILSEEGKAVAKEAGYVPKLDK